MSIRDSSTKSRTLFGDYGDAGHWGWASGGLMGGARWLHCIKIATTKIKDDKHSMMARRQNHAEDYYILHV